MVVESLKRFTRSSDTRDSLQVVGHSNVIPIVQQSANAFPDRLADFHREIAAGLEGGAGGRDEILDDLEPGRSCKDGRAWLKFADLELNRVLLRFADIGWVRDHEVERLQRESAKQIGIVKVNAAIGFVRMACAELELQAGGVGFGDLERGG